MAKKETSYTGPLTESSQDIREIQTDRVFRIRVRESDDDGSIKAELDQMARTMIAQMPDLYEFVGEVDGTV